MGVIAHYARRCRRAFEAKNLAQLLQEKHGNPRKFWKTLRRPTMTLPVRLQDVSAWDNYIQKLASPALPHDCIFPLEAYPQMDASKAVGLNAAISICEVENHLKRLHNGKAVSISGLPSELLRYAVMPSSPAEPHPQHILLPHLLQLLNCFFYTGNLPSQLCTAVITPVYKKGCKEDCSNYRPIAVTEPLYKLYAGILNTRLLDFTESQNLRAMSQAGFRPGLSTLHPLFALQHFIQQAKHRKSALFCCFLDLKSAYDFVQHPLLWNILSRLGVHGTMLAAVQSLYKESKIAINISGRYGQARSTCAGVRQGCPLSPTLFGLFLDGLQRFLASQCGQAGPQLLCGQRVPLLMYADDITLMAHSELDLQALLTATQAFCTAVGLQISPEKSQAVVFSATRSVPQVALLCCNTPVQQVESTKYLGLTVHQKQGLTSACDILHDKMQAAWAILTRQYLAMRCQVSLSLLLSVYRVCIPPVGSYASELWGLMEMPAASKRKRDSIASLHIQCLKGITGLRKSTSTAVVLAELEERPLEFLWAERSVTFWNGLLALPDDNIFRKAALANFCDAVLRGVHNWAWSFRRQLAGFGYIFSESGGTLQPVDRSDLDVCLAIKLKQEFLGLDDCPRACSSQKAMLCTYQSWFARPPWSVRNLLDVPVRAALIRGFLRFRTGCHGLPVDSGRRLVVPRSRRFCNKCHENCIGDEYHVIFECQALADLRQKYHHIFNPSSRTMKQFFWQDDRLSVMCFIKEALSS